MEMKVTLTKDDLNNPEQKPHPGFYFEDLSPEAQAALQANPDRSGEFHRNGAYAFTIFAPKKRK